MRIQFYIPHNLVNPALNREKSDAKSNLLLQNPLKQDVFFTSAVRKVRIQPMQKLRIAFCDYCGGIIYDEESLVRVINELLQSKNNDLVNKITSILEKIEQVGIDIKLIQDKRTNNSIYIDFFNDFKREAGKDHLKTGEEILNQKCENKTPAEILRENLLPLTAKTDKVQDAQGCSKSLEVCGTCQDIRGGSSLGKFHSKYPTISAFMPETIEISSINAEVPTIVEVGGVFEYLESLKTQKQKFSNELQKLKVSIEEQIQIGKTSQEQKITTLPTQNKPISRQTTPKNTKQKQMTQGNAAPNNEIESLAGETNKAYQEADIRRSKLEALLEQRKLKQEAAATEQNQIEPWTKVPEITYEQDSNTSSSMGSINNYLAQKNFEEAGEMYDIPRIERSLGIKCDSSMDKEVLQSLDRLREQKELMEAQIKALDIEISQQVKHIKNGYIKGTLKEERLSKKKERITLIKKLKELNEDPEFQNLLEHKVLSERQKKLIKNQLDLKSDLTKQEMILRRRQKQKRGQEINKIKSDIERLRIDLNNNNINLTNTQNRLKALKESITTIEDTEAEIRRLDQELKGTISGESIINNPQPAIKEEISKKLEELRKKKKALLVKASYLNIHERMKTLSGEIKSIEEEINNVTNQILQYL